MLCEDLVRLGHSVTVVAAVPHYPDGFVSPLFSKHLFHYEERKGVQIIRVLVPGGNRSNLYHRMSAFLVFQLLAVSRGIRLKYDVLVVTNPAIETGLPFGILSILKKRPVLLCVWDVYPEVGIRMGVFRNSLLTGFIGKAEDFCLKRANAIQVLGQGFVKELSAHSVNPEKIAVIPPWLDTGFIRPLPRHNSFSHENNLDSCFVVLHAGNIGFSQGLEYILSAARSFVDQPHIKFVFVGDGANREQLVSQSRELGLSNVLFVPFQPREHLPEVLATADLALISMAPGIGNGSLPSKTFPIFASGRPILAVTEDGSELWNVVNHSKAGVCVPPGNPGLLVSALLELERSPKLRRQMALNGREYSVMNHDRHSAARQFERILTLIMDKRHA